MLPIIKEKSRDLAEICRKYSVRRLELFRSAASERDFDPSTSDLDFIVEFLPDEKRNLFNDYMDLMEEISRLFGRKVDLIENKKFRNPFFREAVEQSRSMIYES